MANRTCSIEGCERVHFGRGWCVTHYRRWATHGSTDLPIRPTLAEKIWSRTDRSGSCWLWLGFKTPLGYGLWRGRMAHRVVYEILVGPVPEGLELDHLCRNPPCVNPAHLEPVTHQENMRRGVAGKLRGAQQLAKTHCKYSHEYIPENTYMTPAGHRVCRTCARSNVERAKDRRRSVA